MDTLTLQQRRAIGDAYTTLRAVCHTYGEYDEALQNICAESASLLVAAFTQIAELEKLCDASEADNDRTV